MTSTAVRASARPNIALVKYWGKREVALNLPAVPSLSITLDALETVTTVRFDASASQDRFTLNGRANDGAAARASAFVDLFRQLAGTAERVVIDSTNNFPTAAGLASSASGFAAMAVALDAALGLGLDARSLSRLARQGSGSAARSIFGGFVEMHAGRRADGEDAEAAPLATADDWPLEVVIALTSLAPKAVGSTDGMTHTAETSPYYAAWVDTAAADLEAGRAAVAARDFAALAQVSERSCLKMHAVAMAADPGLIYWNASTVDCLRCVRELRADGCPVFFTIDAGPQVKAVCPPDAADRVAAALAGVAGVRSVLRTGLGGGARIEV
ncbi:MAG: diphosphomevalonate decarboxylase [Pseudomonadota bacterium]